MFVSPSLKIIFIMLVAVTYSLIFRKYSNSKRKVSTFSMSTCMLIMSFFVLAGITIGVLWSIMV